ncbi:MAG: DegT/DnrJ/EryC1/StrS family aminotransferase [Acidimicrobiales bacterium]|jgi:dTDP-4-amino-4,6-dideoxygalactose transaminase|nr:DegT/DnrJ/EryC1/StrS family aminotransferase [Acidimicrobiales bacterium]
MTITIPITTVRFGAAEEALVLEVLRSGMLAQGPKVARLEELFAEMAGTDHAVAVNNGTTALVAALQALELGPGDEVVTSPFTFVATLNAALEAGATVRFADIDLDDFCIDPAAVASVVTDRTRVLMPVHLYGQAAPMGALASLAEQRGLAVVEDAAQAHGARVDGRPVGGFGQACFSLYATKNVTTGEGGVVTTDDDALADRLRLLRNQGMRARYQYELAGHNYRMTDLQAAVGIPQLERLEEITAARRANAAVLDDGLAGLDGLVTPVEKPGRRHVYHQYTVRVTDDAPLTRDALVDRLAEAGVGSGVYYPRMVHDYDCYRDDPRVVVGDTPDAALAAAQVLSLPVHPHLTRDELDRVVLAVRSAFGG